MSTSNLKTVTLELGGKSPHIIFDDVDLDAAVANALFGLYTNTGQICSAGTRLLVQDSIYDRFLERFVERSKQIKVGNPLDFATRMGPLVSEEQLRKVERYVQIGQREGAQAGLRRRPPEGPRARERLLLTSRRSSPTSPTRCRSRRRRSSVRSAASSASATRTTPCESATTSSTVSPRACRRAT